MRCLSVVDPWLLRRPFVGRAARRYACQRPGFADLDARLCVCMGPDLARAQRVLDVGSGPGHLVAVLRRCAPHAAVIAAEPSPDFRVRGSAGGVRARAEALPFASGTIDLAVLLSVIRHVADRRAAFGELARVVSGQGVVYVAELDPDADGRRIANHVRGITGWSARAHFRRLVLPSCPPAAYFEQCARVAGWSHIDRWPDPIQPCYFMRLSR
jgi:ubiquinone/menaquinone biosynthesis C-methylase UbiE